MIKKNIFLSRLLSSAKYSFLLIPATALFSAVPIDLIYYFLNLRNSFNSEAAFLPLDWLLTVCVTLGILFAVPILAGGITLSVAVWLYRTKVSRDVAGIIIGSIVGVLVSLWGINWFFALTEEVDLENWIFFAAMIGWGACSYSWLGYRIETLYSDKDIATQQNTSQLFHL